MSSTSSEQQKTHKEILVQFIEIYASEPCLWRIKSKDYHDKAKRDAAYNKLLEVYKGIDPLANRDAVIKKINTLRTNYRREKKKIDQSYRSGSGTDEIYVPTLWYYHLFNFLSDQDTPRSSSSNLNETAEETQEHESNLEEPVSNLEESATDLEQSFEISHEITNTSRENTACTKPHLRPQKRSLDRCDNVLQAIENHFKKPKAKEGRYDVFGKNVSMRMIDIQNNTQRLLAERIIDEALFMAEMDLLTTSHAVRSSIDNTNPMYEFPKEIRSSNISRIEPTNTNTQESSESSLASFITSYTDM